MSDNNYNVVVVVLDSLRKDRISPYNEEIDFTPNFEGLASESKLFTEANANAPWTLPSTASMFTGEYPWVHGANHNSTSLDYDGKVLAEKFQENNYRTKVITPNTWISPSIGTVDGFDEVENFLGIAGKGPVQKIFRKATALFNFLGERPRKKLAYLSNIVFEKFTTVDLCKSRETVEATKNFLNDVDDDFFLFVNVMSAHEPYDPGDPPEKYLERHGVEDIENVPSTEREFFNEGYDEEDLKKAYDAAVDYTDDLLGELLESLEENGFEDDTVLVVLGDHGQAAGDEGIYGHQFTVMDSVTEVPLMIRGPGVEQGEEASLLDLKELYSVIPGFAGVEDAPGIGVEEVKGSYEYPEFFVGVIPDDRREKFDRKYRFYRDSEKKVVKSTGRDGDSVYEAFDSDGDEIDVTDDMRDAVDSIGSDSEASEGNDIDDEEVKKRLEDLGYM